MDFNHEAGYRAPHMNLSPIGLMMDSQVPIPAHQKLSLHMESHGRDCRSGFLEFVATSIWCMPDSIQPFLYNAGFSITDISPADLEVVNQIAEKIRGRIVVLLSLISFPLP